MPMFAGERALVTGSASSIRPAIAIASAREGTHVLLADVAATQNAETRRANLNAGGMALFNWIDFE